MRGKARLANYDVSYPLFIINRQARGRKGREKDADAKSLNSFSSSSKWALVSPFEVEASRKKREKQKEKENRGLIPTFPPSSSSCGCCCCCCCCCCCYLPPASLPKFTTPGGLRHEGFHNSIPSDKARQNRRPRLIERALAPDSRRDPALGSCPEAWCVLCPLLLCAALGWVSAFVVGQESD